MNDEALKRQAQNLINIQHQLLFEGNEKRLDVTMHFLKAFLETERARLTPPAEEEIRNMADLDSENDSHVAHGGWIRGFRAAFKWMEER